MVSEDLAKPFVQWHTGIFYKDTTVPQFLTAQLTSMQHLECGELHASECTCVVLIAVLLHDACSCTHVRLLANPVVLLLLKVCGAPHVLMRLQVMALKLSLLTFPSGWANPGFPLLARDGPVVLYDGESYSSWLCVC